VLLALCGSTAIITTLFNRFLVAIWVSSREEGNANFWQRRPFLSHVLTG
jgi:hypothetical protein